MIGKNTQTLRTLWLLTAILGILGSLLSLTGMFMALIVPFPGGDVPGTVMTSIGMAGLLWGIGLVWAGISGWKQKPSPRMYSKWVWIVLLGITIGLFGIGFAIPSSAHGNPLFAILHLGLILCPALLLMFWLTTAAGNEAAPTARQTLVTTVGGVMSIALALPIELIGLFITSIGVTMVTTFLPGGEAEVNQLLSYLQQWQQMPTSDMEALISFIGSPVVLVTLAITLSIITPLVEEFGKTLVMGVMGVWKRPGLRQSFIWGAMCGLGFAIMEGVANGALGLGDVTGWLGGVGSRLFATAMHALTSGMLGLGWGLFWRKRWWALPLTYIGAVIFHGLWNLNVVLLIGGMSIGEAVSPAGYALSVFGIGVELILILLTPLGLFGIPLWLRKRESH